MKKYEIFYKEILIGMLEIRDDGKHKYTPNMKGVEIAKTQVSLIHEMLEASDWRDPIPFFQNRIDNAKRFSTENNISYHTDSFRMIAAV